MPELGFAQGYQTYDWLQPFRLSALAKINNRYRPEFAGNFVAERIDDHFLDWLESNADGRFFAYLHHINVHWPYRSPAPFSGMYMKSPPSEDFNVEKFMPNTNEKHLTGSGPRLSPETLRAMSDAYDEGIRYVDDSLGKMFAELARRGLYDNTLIIITADHGEEFMEHGLIGHGETLYDEVDSRAADRQVSLSRAVLQPAHRDIAGRTRRRLSDGDGSDRRRVSRRAWPAGT